MQKPLNPVSIFHLRNGNKSALYLSCWPLQPGTFAADLLAHGPKPRQLGAVRTFHLTIGKRVPLEAEELEAYEAAKAAAEAEKSDTGARHGCASSSLMQLVEGRLEYDGGVEASLA